MITIKDLTKKYEDTIIFEHTDYQFPDQGLVCLLGASGSGKSTLLNMLAGFDSEYEGNILVGNQNLSKLSSDELCAYRRDHIGFVFQNYCLLPRRTVLENVMLPCTLHPMDESVKQTSLNLLERVGMSDKAQEKVENLSGGQKQRAAIARALNSDPTIILADEPTGALDRTNSNEIMTLLKAASKHRLVVVITHDSKICKFADEVIRIENHKIVTDRQENINNGNKLFPSKTAVRPSVLKLGGKNFGIHFLRYAAVALAISMGVVAFLLSLSYGNVIAGSIEDFQEKNTAFGNGYIKIDKEEPALFSLLSSDERLDNVYYQYAIQDISLFIDGKTEVMAEKYPMPKATEQMSYGTMPGYGQNEIALSPSLAKKFDSQINDLIGKAVVLTYQQQEYSLTVSGIFNSGYDDFFVSADVEQTLYQHTDKNAPYALSYDVKRFEDVVSVTQAISDHGINPQTAVKEVEAMQKTFQNIQTIFLMVSVLILAIAVFISAVLLVKMQHTRYHELGLLSALGFHKSAIRNMVISENLLLSGLAAVFSAILIGGAIAISGLLHIDFRIGVIEYLVSVLGTGVIVVLISILAALKPLHTEPAQALRK